MKRERERVKRTYVREREGRKGIEGGRERIKVDRVQRKERRLGRDKPILNCVMTTWGKRRDG